MDYIQEIGRRLSTAFLKEKHSVLTVDTSRVQELVGLYSHYQDAPTRQAAKKALASLQRESPDEFDKAISRILLVTKRLPASDLATLLEWTDEVVATTKTPTATLVHNQAVILAKVLTSDDKRHRLVTSAYRNVRHAVSRALLTLGSAQVFLDALLKDKSLDHLVLLCAVADAAADLTAVPKIRDEINDKKEAIYAAYIQLALGSKVPLTDAVTKAFTAFFAEYTTQDDFDTVLVPALSKALLRAPETVLVHIVPDLVWALSPGVDVAGALEKSLLKSIISSMGSSNEALRQNALATLLVCLKHSYSEQSLKKIVGDIAAALKRTSNADQRALYAKALIEIRPGLCSADIASGLSAVVAKELNETSLMGLAEAHVQHLVAALNDGAEVDKAAIEAVTKGVSDKKPNVRKVWICEVVRQVAGGKPSAGKVAEFIEGLSKPFKAAFDEILANPNTAVTNKGVSAIHALMVLDPQTYAAGLAVTENPRVYQKLVTEYELYWAVRATAAVKPTKEHKPWFEAWYYFLSSPQVVYKSRCQAADELKGLYASDVSIGQGLIESLSPEAFEAYPNLQAVLAVLGTEFTEDKDRELAKKNLADALVVAHHERARIKGGWIGLCLRSQVDPGELVTTYLDSMIANVTQNSQFPAAADAAAATIAFINHELVVPKLVAFIQQQTDTSTAPPPTREELIIWKTPSGELAQLEEESKKQYREDRNVKDYETKKWEESVRADIAKKKAAAGGPKKLSKEEQAQLAEQEKIRQAVESRAARLRRPLKLVEALSKAAGSVENGKAAWFPPSVMCLIGLLRDASDLVGSEAAACMLALSTNITDRFDSLLRRVVGVVSLRALGADALLEADLTVEPLKEQATRVLYKLKFLGDQRALDECTLMYVQPLLLGVIQGKGVGKKLSSEDVEEQIILALDILSAHAEQLVSIPRGQLVSNLITLMHTMMSRAKNLRDCLVSVIPAISVYLTEEETQAILTGAVSPDGFVRTTMLELIDAELDLSGGYSPEVLIERFDQEHVNASLATEIWEDSQMKIDESTISTLLPFLGSKSAEIRSSTARAVAAVASSSNTVEATVDMLIGLYLDASKPPEPVYDRFGILIKNPVTEDRWEPRAGVPEALRNMAELLNAEVVSKIFTFLIESALGDKNANVRRESQACGLDIIAKKGVDSVEHLMTVFEEYLARPDSQSKDEVSEAVVIFYGALARHLKAGDARLEKIVDRLISTLDVPSEDVQLAVSECLDPLAQLVIANIQAYFDKLLAKLVADDKYAGRRGAAYGIAGLVKGCGIAALSDHNIIRALIEGVEDKKDPKKRQGAQFAFECLSKSLQKYFEPYVIEVLPIILACLGDPSPEVRQATNDAAKVIMKNTTGYGIKKLIPLALENLDQTAWRAKKGAVELLGTMAYLDPRQLSTSLSTIIPEIVGVLNDTHKEVRNAANQSLQRFGEVIRNPEIQALVPVLVKAIGDPTRHTDEALDGLLKTQFVHYIDAPSLALLVHVLNRGLKDRSAATKRKACQIVGNMSILTDSRDLTPYLPQLVAELEVAMVDPVPATRATASKALGSLVEKLGEEPFPDLIPRLLDTLRDPNRAGDRMGSAQALAEVAYGLGISKLEELLPEILAGATSPRQSVRLGFAPLLLYLPAVFGTSLSPYLNQLVPPLLGGLADSSEEIRDISLKAGRAIVRGYATKAVDLLLPEFERGLFDDNHRIRLSSVELTGDLLYQITGISQNADEDTISFSNVGKILVEVLGAERRDRILASLFICRSDTSGLVRSSALDVWKSLVANTPRTVKEILPSLTQLVIRGLANSNEEHRTIAAHALGDLVRRVGSNALAQLLPTLEEGMATSDSDAKQGICIALVELIRSTPTDVLQGYEKTIIALVRGALTDTDPVVREAAGQAFEVIQEVTGAAGDILPELIKQMEDGDESSLAALTEMMATKSDVVFPSVVPVLLKPPMTPFKAQSLATLSAAAGTDLYRSLSPIVDALVAAREADEDTAYDTALDEILLCVVHDEGSHSLMQHMLSLAKKEKATKREIVFTHMAKFFESSQLDYSIYTAEWLSTLVMSLDDREHGIVVSAWTALNALVKSLSKEEMEQLVKPARQALQLTGAAGSDLPGFALPKGPSCILPIFFQGLMYGTSEQREQAALGIADVVERTAAANLKPFVTQMTGPLIRTIGERFPSDVKAAILYTLNVLLSKLPAFLKPFLPQLQRTFAKSLSDASNALVRTRAAKALGTLITLQARVDPLVNELVAGARASTDAGVTTAMLQALYEVVANAGGNLGDASKTLIVSFVAETVPQHRASPATLRLLARTLASLINVVSDEQVAKIVKTALADEDREFAVLTLNGALKYGADKLASVGLTESVASYFIEHANAENAPVSENSVIGIGKFLLSPHAPAESDPIIESAISTLAGTTAKTASHSLDTRRLSLVVLRTVARLKYSMIAPFLDILMVPLFSCVRDQIIAVKLAAEKAYLAVLQLVDNPDSKIFETWFEHAKEKGIVAAQQQRSIQDYTRRVAVRLAQGERERIEAGGDDEQVFSDRIEDENEIWAVGTVDMATEA